jgi:7-cyano-7-deazaguanine synthase in queuosine biosynthesis
LPERVCVLTSGGLDSRLLLGRLGAVHCARHRIPALALALLADNPFPDATPAFLADLGRLARSLRHCGRCTKCAERQRAFAAAGVPDPTRYVR